MSESKAKTINVRVSESEKSIIEGKANSVSLGTSEFLRTAALSDDKIILLQEGATIAKKLCELVCTFEKTEESRNIGGIYATTILSKIEELIASFNKLSEKLTDISENDVSDDEEVTT